ENRDVSPQFKPFTGEVLVGDGKLPLHNLLVIANLRLLLDYLLVLLEGLFIFARGFVATTDQVLGLRSVIRKRPNPHDATSGLERQAKILFVEGALRHVQLIFGARPLLFASFTPGRF